MKLLGLDISTKAGWAVLDSVEGGPPALKASGLVEKTKKNVLEYGPYPGCYKLAARDISSQLLALIGTHKPDVVVIEETNQGKNRYTQKLLEFIHKDVIDGWDDGSASYEVEVPCHACPEQHKRDFYPKLVYISTGIWKHALGLKKPKDAKKNDELLKQAKGMAAAGTMTLAQAKKKLGIKGKWNKKMLAVNLVNETFGLNFKLKNNDEAEAMCLVLAFLKGAPVCDGDPNPNRNEE